MTAQIRPSPPFRGEKEGPGAKRWEGEVGAGERSGIPHLTLTLSAPRGREGEFRALGSSGSSPDFLALEGDVGDREDDDQLGDEPGQLRPDQEEALRRRQRRAEQGALDLADQAPGPSARVAGCSSASAISA